MIKWPQVPLGELLYRSDEPAELDPDTEYQEVTIRLWGKGVVSRGKVLGADVATPRRIVRSGQLILSRIDARNGALGMVPSELDGAIVSNDFPSFELQDTNKCLPGFIRWLVQCRSFINLCKASSEGTTNRVRVKEDRFLRQRVPLPSLAEQQEIAARLDALAAKSSQLATTLDAMEADTSALVRAHLFGDAANEYSRRRMSELLALRSPDVAVDRTKRYQFAGVYSFGRGVFASANKMGSDFAYDRLSMIREGDFIYPKLMAWEGALGTVPPECDGMVVSPEFPVFTVNTDAVMPEVLDIYFRTPSIWPLLSALSGGTNLRRRRIQPRTFLDYEMPVPPMAVQRRVCELSKDARALNARYDAIRADNAALLPAMLERVFSSSMAGN